jgi:hypothetical protein
MVSFQAFALQGSSRRTGSSRHCDPSLKRTEEEGPPISERWLEHRIIVSPQTFEVAAEDGENANFKRILSTTGCGDRLGIVFNVTRLQLIGSQELRRITYSADQPPAGRYQRSPLLAEFQDARSNRRFLFMVNHLARNDDALRRDQGRRLNEWIRTQTLPVIACGDYNFDWSMTNGERSHDVGFDRMTADGH